ncbi:helix-turn-helix domain-containing protein [Streptomyces sp. NPDC059900]|uniref:AraC family transcriptional regulator n=1 Tax=Streptomyces sp. NPDC059900 TaxID=3155816 RepID=UPI00343F0789
MITSQPVSLPVRTVFEWAEPKSLDQYLRDLYGPHVSTHDVQSDSWRHVRTDAGSFAVDDMRLRADYSFCFASPDLIITELHNGRVERGFGPDSERIGPGDVLMMSHPDLDARGRCHDFDARAVTLPAGAVTQVAGESVRFTGHQPLSPAAAQLWKRTIDYLARDLLASPEAAGQPLLWDNAARLLAATVLTVFPNTAVHGAPLESGPDRPPAVPALLRRAQAFTEDNAHRNIGVAEIAAAVHLTPRALQYAFRRHLDTTPTAYLRRVRLHHAHEELSAADPASGKTVTGVAARWGFLHPGRFAAAYRLAYGRSPGLTLKS